MQSTIKIHEQDNVAVALRDLAAGERVELEGAVVKLAQPVARGHKFALGPIAEGEDIIKYGQPIGHALAAIAPGEHIHSQNVKTNLSDLDSYRYQPQFPALPPQAADREVQLYRRANGEVGIRNELWIVPTVGCVNGIARQIQQRFCSKHRRTGSTACICSATRSAARSWGRIMPTPASCCRTWRAIPTPARCW